MESVSNNSGIDPGGEFKMEMKQLRKLGSFPKLNIIKLK